MGEDLKGFGEQLYNRLQGKGLSKYQVDKVLALQRLDPEVSELGAKGLLAEAQLLEISKINSAARQKQLAELTVEKNLPASWVKHLTKLIRSAEKARTDAEANRYWDFFFEIKEMIEKEGPTRAILGLIRNFDGEKAGPPREPGAPAEAAPHDDRRVVSFNKMDLEMGRGLDVGTVNICAAARRKADGLVAYNIQRNAFLDVRSDTFTKKMLMKLGIDYIVQGDKGYVIGDPAFELANIFEKNTRRPMKDGMISPVEPEALLIVSLIIAELLGHPKEVGEVCAFSVPGDPIDVERNVIYHRGALEAVLRKLGYTPRPMLEGHSIVFAELREQEFTGIGISCGGGMFNVCVAYKSVPALTFATSRGGDWIDNNVAQAIGLPASQVCAIKESGVDLMNPQDRVQDAIVIYYRNLIQYTLESIKQKFEMAQNMPTFARPIDVVCGGGTSMIGGFIDVFREEFEKINFPLEINEIRMARDPLKAVSAGCMEAAIEETRALTEVQVALSPAALERTAAQTQQKADTGTKRRLANAFQPPLLVREDTAVKAAPPPKPPSTVMKAASPPALPTLPPRPPSTVMKAPAPPPLPAAPKPPSTVFKAPPPPPPPPPPPTVPEAEELEEIKPEELEEVQQLEEVQKMEEVEEIEDLDSEEGGSDDEPKDLPLIS